jgi:hypothetical protein
MTRASRRYCRSCGAEAPDAGRFCSSCGSSLSVTTPYPAPDHVRYGRQPTDGAVPRAIAERDDAVARGGPGVVTPTVAGSVRMGFGIALGMLLFALVVTLFTVVVVAVVAGWVTWPLAQSGRTFSGTGPADSAALVLEGHQVFEWTASPTTPSACGLWIAVRSQADPGIDIEIARARIEASPIPSGRRALDLAGRSDYFIHVETDCRWSMRLTRE